MLEQPTGLPLLTEMLSTSVFLQFAYVRSILPAVHGHEPRHDGGYSMYVRVAEMADAHRGGERGERKNKHFYAQ